MAWSVDARVVVRLGDLSEVAADEAVLFEGDRLPEGLIGESFAATQHDAGCACCGARSPAAIALDRLFGRRARGSVPFFRRVVAVTATAQGDLAVFAAVRNDRLASARYRLDGTS